MTVKKTLIKISTIFLVIICFLSSFLIIIREGSSLPLYYGKTYYAALPLLHDRLKSTEGRKIIIIGNSGTAFGVDSTLLEKLLKERGYGYSVRNFGLYGKIGTKVMLDLSLDDICEGDIVLYMPEPDLQAQSLYFSREDLWYSLEARPELIRELDFDSAAAMYCYYPLFVSEKIKLGREANPSGVYGLSSFDGNMDLKSYDRSYNEMEAGYDENNPVDFDALRFDSEYYDYVNEYYGNVLKAGGSMYFVYSPVNAMSVKGSAEGYVNALEQGYDFKLLGNINDSIMDSGWFYDSNFHLNDAGMEVFTVKLLDTIKYIFGDSSVTEYTLPDLPSEENTEEIITGDNSDEDCFEYEEYNGGYRVKSLTEKGKEKYMLTVPCSHNGKKVNAVYKEMLKSSENIRELVIQENIRSLPDYMLEGLPLEKLTVKVTDPSKISVGSHLLFASAAKIYVPAESVSAYKNNYFWAQYAKEINGYEA